ncbi:PTS sugar transporter subunit IIA [Actinomyces gaoshouyii]|uniref:Ascorbate-specific PTS system EIIA component n=1 Tax=Actinomyces gaoshouyii TaxID=1960083 RepID=A0A8H9HB81_9ACTO|nr:PTS sugar transporter subunit IIA [Actinomyces gaoshouyii]GGO97828.1 PTS sugar transporter [Actinomyces gaoshouyii]
MPTLSDLIQPDAIQLQIQASDWRAAVSAAGSALVGAGACGPSYAQAMLKTVEEHGPYIVIAPGFALPHARPDDSVTRTAMSVVRLAEPIAFGNEDNDPVRLVMGLVAVDDDAHRGALVELAGLLADPRRRDQLMAADTPEAVLGALGPAEPEDPAPARAPTVSPAASSAVVPADAVASKGLVLTVCGNGLGTSLFLKNTLEKVLEQWGWAPYLKVEATDTISAKGRAKEADVVMTSAAIAQTLGDLGVPVEVITDFTSTSEIDAALRRIYAV